MRHFLNSILYLIICTLTVSAQTATVDVLINRIHNDQLYGACHYFWFLEMKSPAADSLIVIGKPATEKLLPLLTDNKKGIIVHYILSNIWLDTQPSWTSFAHYDKDKSITYKYCGLKFLGRSKGKKEEMYAKREDLDKNRSKWLDLLSKSSR